MVLLKANAICDAGGNVLRAEAASAIVGAGIAVMGHTGLMPQSVSVLGGFGPQGRTADSALLVIQDAIVSVHTPAHAPGFVVTLISNSSLDNNTEVLTFYACGIESIKVSLPYSSLTHSKSQRQHRRHLCIKLLDTVGLVALAKS